MNVVGGAGVHGRWASHAVGWRHWLVPLAIAALGLVLNVIVASSMAETADESTHVNYGVHILEGRTDRYNPSYDSKMPVSALNALPRAISKVMRSTGHGGRLAALLQDFRAARYPTILASVLLGLLAYVFAAGLYGRVPGLLVQCLFVLSPNLMAHGTLATTDLYVTLGSLLFLFTLRRHLLRPGTANAVICAVALGLTQLTKFSAIYLYLVLLLALAAMLAYSRHASGRSRAFTWRHATQLIAWVATLSLVLINAGFLFQGSLTPLASYSLDSTLFRHLQQIPGLRDIPIPLPYAYVRGFDMMKHHDATGISFSNIVLCGEVRGEALPRSEGWPSYYAVAYALKEPIGMQILLLAGLWWAFRARQPADFLVNELPLLLTAAVYGVALSFFSNTQIGIRHILPALAALMIVSGGAFVPVSAGGWRRKVLPIGCLLWTAVSVATYYPHVIPYFNEFLRDRKMAYRYLVDSNLDWGQDLWVVERFLKQNPDVVLNPSTPTSGRILVGANWLSGMENAGYWLHGTTLKPVAHVGYAHLLFEIPAR